MAAGDPSNPYDELEGLLAGIIAATAQTLPERQTTVINREYDGVWPGPFPLIRLGPPAWHVDVMPESGGNTGRRAQRPGNPSLYPVSIEDIIDHRAPRGERVADRQTDIFLLIKAINEWFNIADNKLLPVGGTPTVYRAGDHISFRPISAFMISDVGEVRLVAAGTIGIYGIPHLGRRA